VPGSPIPGSPISSAGNPASGGGLPGPSQASPPPAQGTIDSGGGKVLSCLRDGKTKVELLDLWEGRELMSPPAMPLASTSSVAEQASQALQRLKGLFPNPMEFTVKSGDKAFTGAEAFLWQLNFSIEPFLQDPAPESMRRWHDKSLEPTQDSLEEAIPAGCDLLQAIRYQDASGRILVNEDLVQAMDATNQAALYVHEAVYKILREQFGERNSKRTRRAVALAFSGYAFPVLAALKGPRIECFDGYDSHSFGTIDTLSKLTIYADPKPDPATGSPFRIRAEMVGGVAFLGEADWLAPFSASRVKTLDELLNFRTDKWGDDAGGQLQLASRVDFDLLASISVRAQASGPAKFFAAIQSSPTPPRTLDARELQCRRVGD
jgi:hypothetical protein